MAEGLALVDRLGEVSELDQYPLFHAARADLLRRLGQVPEAVTAYERALGLTTNAVEQDYLRRRLQALGQISSPAAVDFPNEPRRRG